LLRFSQLYFHIIVDFASQLFLGKDTNDRIGLKVQKLDSLNRNLDFGVSVW